MTKVGNPDWHSDVSLTATSEYYQDGGCGSRGRITIANARMNEEGWNTADFSKSPAATKILEEHPKLREQIEACTASRCMIADINHGQYKELRELIVKVLTLENKRECHNLLQLVRTMKHANKLKNPQLFEVYDAVDKLLWGQKRQEQLLLSNVIRKKVKNTRT